ncbi:cell wall-binding repeat-containing protein [Clostridium senegalense]
MRSKKLLKTIGMVCIFAILSSGSMIKNVYADENYTKDRLFGVDRFETANKIADEFAKTNAELGLEPDWQGNYIYVDTATNPVDTVILANGFDFPDALCSAPLSKTLNATVLLTHNNTLTDSTKKQIEKMNIKNVTIVGGTSAISENVENQLKSMKINVSRLGGVDRYDTSYLIAKSVAGKIEIKGATIVGGTVWQDAMISAPGATIQNKPILLVPISENPVLPKYKSLLEENKLTITDSDLYGDYKNMKSDILRAMIPNNLYVDEENKGILYHTFEGGLENKYTNSFAILDHAYTRTLPYRANANVFLTRGDDFADSLAVAPLSAKKASPIVFGTPVHKSWSKWDEFNESAKQETERLNYPVEAKLCEAFCNDTVKKIKNTIDKVTLIGGENVMSENADDIFRGIWK